MTKEKSVYILFKNIIKEFLESQSIDINNPEYESSEQWQRIKDISISKIRLEEFVKMHLMADETGFESMQYKYEMGNNSAITEEECEDRVLAEHIIFEFVDRDKEEDDEIDNEMEVICNYFKRLQERLKEYLNFDLEKFDNNNNKNKIERSKILFFFYMLEKEYFSNKEILTVFNKPSMENIEINKVRSFGGMVIKFIKKSLEREMSFEEIYEINREICDIVYTWDHILENAYILIDFLEGKGYEYDFQETIKCLRYEEEDKEKEDKEEEDKEEEDKEKKCISNYLGSPVEVLYLKIIQHEYLSNIMDIIKTNNIPFNYSHELSQELICEMKELHNSYVDLDNVEEYIEKNARKIAKYVYLGAEIKKDDIKRIKNFKEKISRWIGFCFRAKPWLNREDIANELQIVSALQAIILDSSNERMKYIYYNYEQKGNHHSDVSVQAALRTDDYVLDALKCYWVRKVADRWYSNIGRGEVRVKAKSLEEVSDNILIQILSKSSLKDMQKIHNMYFNRVDLSLISTKEQLWEIKKLENYFSKIGFRYIDEYYKIRYVFSNPEENSYIYIKMIENIGDAIKDNKSSLEGTIQSLEVLSNDKICYNISFSFDYQRKECILEDIDIQDGWS